MDPCLTPTSLTPIGVADISYSYTDQTPTVSITYPAFTVDPSVCQHLVTHTCSNTGSRTDLCSLGTSGTSLSLFDTSTLQFDFHTTDMVAFLPDTYVMTITG